MENLLKSEIEPLIDVMSVHQYITSDEPLMKWRELATEYNKSLWSTEWGDWANAGYPDNKPYEQAMKYANKIHEGLKVLKANAWVIWEPGFIYDSNMFYLTPRKAYWAVAHYSRHIRPGFVQVACKDSLDGCKSTAWIGPANETLVIVSVNDSETDQTVHYDFSKFDSINIQEIRLTSESQDYKLLEFDQAIQSKSTVKMPSGSILTLTASLTD
jgi:O-glycosyl hydrolase